MAEAKKITVVLMVDYWPEDDVRVSAGTEIQVDVETAMDMVERGIAKRARG